MTNRMTMLFAGIGIGAAAGIYYARHSACIDKQVTEGAEAAKGFLKDQAGSLADRAGKASAKVEQHVAGGQAFVRDMNKKAKDAIGNASDATMAVANDVLDQAKNAASQASAVIDKQKQRLERA